MGPDDSETWGADAPEREPPSGAWDARYAELQTIGEGGFGTVLRVQDRAGGDGDLLALKRPSSNHPDVLARFRREIEEQSKLRHPNIMPILDSGPNFDWYCMPIALGSLYDQAPEMSDDELLQAFEDVARGLQFAHDHDNVHRDVKPGNILLLDRDGRHWVIGDFGLVRRPRGQTTNLKTRAALGTEGTSRPRCSLPRTLRMAS